MSDSAQCECWGVAGDSGKARPSKFTLSGFFPNSSDKRLSQPGYILQRPQERETQKWLAGRGLCCGRWRASLNKYKQHCSASAQKCRFENKKLLALQGPSYDVSLVLVCRSKSPLPIPGGPAEIDSREGSVCSRMSRTVNMKYMMDDIDWHPAITGFPQSLLVLDFSWFKHQPLTISFCFYLRFMTQLPSLYP